MPKAKPTQVITHRIELQDKEREIIENYAYSSMVAQLLPAVVASVGIGMAGYGLYYFFKEVYEIGGDIIEDIGNLWDKTKSAVDPTNTSGDSVIGSIIAPFRGETAEPPVSQEVFEEQKARHEPGGDLYCEWWDVACQLENALIVKMFTEHL